MFRLQKLNVVDCSRIACLIFGLGVLVGCADQRHSVAGVDFCIPAQLIDEVKVPWWVPSNLPSSGEVRVKLASSTMADLAGYAPMVGLWGQPTQPYLRIGKWSHWQAWSARVPDSHYEKVLVNPSTPKKKIAGTAFTAVFTAPDQSGWIVVKAPIDEANNQDALRLSRLIAVCRRPDPVPGRQVSADSARCFRVLRDGPVALSYDFAAANVSIIEVMDERVRHFAAQLRCAKP